MGGSQACVRVIAVLFYHATFLLIDGTNVCVRSTLINHSARLVASYNVGKQSTVDGV